MMDSKLMIDIETFLKNNFKSVKINGEQAQLVCPFHKDHAPGHLYMNIRSGLWMCHHATCNLSGNFNKFLQLTRLSETYSVKDIELEKFSEKEINFEIQYILPESVISSFTSKLPTELLKAGFSQETLKKKNVGFDEYRYRIVYPIRDSKGNLVGLSGKNLIRFGDEPKYKFYNKELQEVYPNYRFNKSQYLYNMDQVFPKLLYSSKNEEVIIVEGFKACLWLLQHGYKNVVALMGVPASKDQINLLRQLSNKFISFLDKDEGGIAATKQIVEELSSGTVFIVSGDKKQPDDYNETELMELFRNKKILEDYLEEVNDELCGFST